MGTFLSSWLMIFKMSKVDNVSMLLLAGLWAFGYYFIKIQCHWYFLHVILRDMKELFIFYICY